MDQQAEQKNTNTQKRFSVLITAYNIEDYIERAITSVVNQTLKNIEIIVVNDCSTDKTGEKIEQMKKSHNDIIYIERKINKKIGATRNAALDAATGEYIIFLDGDDYLSNNKVLEKLDKVIGKDKVDVVYLGFKIEGNREELVIPTPETCTKTYKAATDQYPNVWSKCWRREFLEKNKIRFPEGRLYEDVLFVYRAVMKSNSYKIADFVVHNYISGRKGSITTKIGLKNVEDTIQNLKDLEKMRKQEYTEEIDIIIKKEVKMCKKRLDDAIKAIYKSNNKQGK